VLGVFGPADAEFFRRSLFALDFRHGTGVQQTIGGPYRGVVGVVNPQQFAFVLRGVAVAHQR